MAASIAKWFYCRSSDGLFRVDGTHAPYTQDSSFEGGGSKTVRLVTFSEYGDRAAWQDETGLHIFDTVNSKLLHTIPSSPVSEMTFSPQSTFLATWFHFSVNKRTKQAPHNLNIYDVVTGAIVVSFHQKDPGVWAPQWSKDEKVCGRVVNGELQFYDASDFSKVVAKLHIIKTEHFSIARSSAPYSVATYAPGVKGQPSFVRIYKYPNFGGNSSAVASRSFFNAERCSIQWNSKGTAVLALTSTETSQSSYYGDQKLYFVSTISDSCIVPLGKEGPVYAAVWNPAGTQFTVVYGYMPAKTTIYNLKNEAVFDFGTGPRNQVFYSPHGTILCLAGFGNLQGNLEFWDLQALRQISSVSARDVTHFEWCPDGEHILTATLSPRMRVGNGYKIWHYTGSCMNQFSVKDANTELYQATWCPVRAGAIPPPEITYTAKPTTEKIPTQASAQAYRPPGARGRPASTPLHKYEAPSIPKSSSISALIGPSQTEPISKSARKKEARKAREAAEQGQKVISTNKEVTEKSASVDKSLSKSQQSAKKSSSRAGGGKEKLESSSDVPNEGFTEAPSSRPTQTSIGTDKDKRIKQLRKKLLQIEKMRAERKSGKNLNSEQIAKLDREAEILAEIESLSVK